MPRGIPKKKARKIFIVKETFTTLLNGTLATVVRGATVREGHELLNGREPLFRPFKVDYEVDEKDEDEDEVEETPTETPTGPVLKMSGLPPAK